ncbi:hypothetical protein ACROYT_G035153 [Oculina patagonica]
MAITGYSLAEVIRIERDSNFQYVDFRLPSSQCPSNKAQWDRFHGSVLSICWCTCADIQGRTSAFFEQPSYGCTQVSSIRHQAGCQLLFQSESADERLAFFPTDTVREKNVSVPANQRCSFFFGNQSHVQYLDCTGSWRSISQQNVLDTIELTPGWSTTLLKIRIKAGSAMFQNIAVGRLVRVAIQCRHETHNWVNFTSSCVLFQVHGALECPYPQPTRSPELTQATLPTVPVPERINSTATVSTSEQPTTTGNTNKPSVSTRTPPPVITCPALPAPSNGTRLGCSGNATMYYNTTCQFSCNNGYIGSGSQERRCQQNGTWSGQDFTCQIINCTSLTVDPRSPLRMSSCDNHYGSKCTFSCAIGHRLNGSSTVTCVAPGNQHPGVWNNTIPVKWKKQTEDDFKIEVARLATIYCDADGTRCQLIPASSRGKRSSNNLVFSRDRVHILPGYPKQLSDDPLIALLACYLQFPQAVSDDIVRKDVLIAIIESDVSSIEVSINGTILSVQPLFSSTKTTEKSDEESKPANAIIIGVCVGVLLLVIIIVAVVLACKRSNR